MTELLVNGVHLSNNVWCTIESTTGLLQASPLRPPGIIVPGVHGEAPAALMIYGPGTVTIPLRVFGVDRTTGLKSGDGTQQLEANLRYLTGLFHQREVVVDHVYGAGLGLFPGGGTYPGPGTYPGGGTFTKRATCRLRTDPFVGERVMSDPPTVTASVSLSLPSGFWRDAEPITTDVYEFATGQEQEITEFAGADGVHDDLFIRILGIAGNAAHNPRIYTDDDRTVFGYDEVVASGRELGVDVAEWDLSPGAGDTWDPDVRFVRYVPYARWFQLDGRPDGPPSIRVTHTGGGLIGVQFTGRRAYRTG